MKKKQYTSFDAEGIEQMADWASLNNMNRQVHERIIQELDPHGVNILLHKILHNHSQGIKVDPHWRIFVLVKLKDREAPVNINLDVDMDLYSECVRRIQ
jgi:hypothetical protein